MNENKRLTSAGNIAFLMIVLLVSILLVTLLKSLIWPLRLLWAQSCFSFISLFGINATISQVQIFVPELSSKFPFSFASPYIGMLLFVETLVGLAIISFFLVRSILLKWSILLLSIPASILVTLIPISLSVFIGLIISPNAGFFIYFELLWVFTHVTLGFVLAIFGFIAWKI